MRPIVIVLIVLALGTAVIAAVLVRQFLASQTVPPAATSTTQTGTQNVLVAAHDIVPGAVLTAEDIRWEPWPDTLIDERFVVQPPQVENQPAAGPDPQQDFLDRIARRSIMAGEPMTHEMVIKQGDSSVTAANLAPGFRAITINVSPAQGVAGLILPNDRVDVIMNVAVRDLTGLEGWKDVVLRYSSETIMHDVRVVAINQKLSHDPKEGVAEPGNLVTLEIKPEQAERLLVSQQLGTLSLTLRSMVPGLSDKDKQQQQTYTMDVRASRALSSLVALDLEEDEDSLPKTTAEAVAMAKERAKRRTEVKINRGGTIAIQKFGQ